MKKCDVVSASIWLVMMLCLMNIRHGYLFIVAIYLVYSVVNCVIARKFSRLSENFIENHFETRKPRIVYVERLV